MKIPEHLALSFLLAQFGVQQTYGTTGTVLMVTAGILPDLDGVSILGGWQCHRTYHRVLGHGLPVTLLGPLGLAYLGHAAYNLTPLLPLWIWLQVALLAHLVTDFCFYRWPVQLLWPLSSWGVGFGLVSWNDLVPTLVLYAGVVLIWSGLPPFAAGICVAALVLYLALRAWFPFPRTGWYGWLAGNWTRGTARFWRWLTGDFIT